MNERPRFQGGFSNSELILLAAALFALIASFWLIGSAWPMLPELIPTHFGLSGRADAWGGRSSIYLLPVISTVLYGILFAVARIPQRHNYPCPVTPDNHLRLYRLNRGLLYQINLIFSFVGAVTVHATIETAHGRSDGLNPFQAPLLLVLVLVTLGVYFRLLKRAARARET